MKSHVWRFAGEEYEGTKQYIQEELTAHANDQIGSSVENLLGGLVIYKVTGGPGGKVVEEAFALDVTVTVKLRRDERFDPQEGEENQ